jgi:hypothetical protein
VLAVGGMESNYRLVRFKHALYRLSYPTRTSANYRHTRKSRQSQDVAPREAETGQALEAGLNTASARAVVLDLEFGVRFVCENKRSI